MYSHNRLYGSEICRPLPIRQMGKHKRFFRQAKGSGIIVTIDTLRQTKIKQNGKREDSNRTLRRQNARKSTRNRCSI